MAIEEVKKRINDILDYSEREIRNNYNNYKKNDNDEFISKLNGQQLGQFILNKTVLENILNCLDDNQEVYRCFTPLRPILEELYSNKKDYLPVYGYLLAKAKKIETDYDINKRYLDIIKGKRYNHQIDNLHDNLSYCFENEVDQESLKHKIFLDNIVSDDGKFKPYILTNYDRFMLQVIGLDFDEVSLIGKHCRSLYRQNNQNNHTNEVIKGTRKVDTTQIHDDIKAKKAKLYYLKAFLSLDDYSVVSSKMITNEEVKDIISILKELDFKEDKIAYIQRQIIKFNNTMANNELLNKTNKVKEELFTLEMTNKYDEALSTINDNNVIYGYLKEKIQSEINYIDSIIFNYVNHKESKEDTIEYLNMAFEDLDETMKLCGPGMRRKI